MNVSYKIAEEGFAILAEAISESKKEHPDTRRHARLMRLRKRLAALEKQAVSIEKEWGALAPYLGVE